jgi:hypothetical protein
LIVLALFRGFWYPRARVKPEKEDVTELSDGTQPESADRTLKQGRTAPDPARRHKAASTSESTLERRNGVLTPFTTSRRCQRSYVTGETKNDDHAGLGSERLNAASSSLSTGRSYGRVTLTLQDK